MLVARPAVAASWSLRGKAISDPSRVLPCGAGRNSVGATGAVGRLGGTRSRFAGGAPRRGAGRAGSLRAGFGAGVRTTTPGVEESCRVMSTGAGASFAAVPEVVGSAAGEATSASITRGGTSRERNGPSSRGSAENETGVFSMVGPRSASAKGAKRGRLRGAMRVCPTTREPRRVSRSFTIAPAPGSGAGAHVEG
jgi:hypothetical protein